MQQNLATKINQYLPAISANELSFHENSDEYKEAITNFTESIQNWSHTILEKAKLPNSAHEAKGLISKYSQNKDVGCALRIVVELEALQKSLNVQDAATAALASMKLLENVWYSSIFKDQIQTNSQVSSAAKTVSTTNNNNVDNKVQLYQETINELKDKYPHCNINALRLLAATRLNIGKQELDDLDITPN